MTRGAKGAVNAGREAAPVGRDPMGWFATALCVAAGGALGALCRFLVAAAVTSALGAPAYVGIVVVNLIGAFAIGVLFVLFEAVLRRDGKSLLQGTPAERHLGHVRGLVEEDPTLEAVDHFRAAQSLRFASSFAITGFLGGFTTFSSFALFSVLLAEGGQLGHVALNVAGTFGVGLLAVAAGLLVGKTLALRWLSVRAPHRVGTGAER